jgi:hypothetical protein
MDLAIIGGHASWQEDLGSCLHHFLKQHGQPGETQEIWLKA